MTKETKIGLLVGLAFIILFAIILSEKGTTRRSAAPPAFTIADASRKAAPPTGTEAPLHDAGRLPVESQLPPIVKPATEHPALAEMTEEPIGQPIPEEGEPIEPLPESLVAMLNLPSDGTNAEADDATSTEPQASAEAAEAADSPPRGSSSEILKDQQQTPAVGTAELPPRKAAKKPTPKGLERHLASAAPPAEAHSPKKTPKPQAIKTIHIVKPGENLGKIAARYYGRATPARITAIFEANRDVLEHIDRVRAQDKLRIPELAGLGDHFEPAPDFPVAAMVSSRGDPSDGPVRIPLPVEESSDAKTQEPGTRDQGDATSSSGRKLARTRTPKFRWYEVKEKDTLSLIARRELGSEKRYSEIYRLNRDRISDQNLIRPGMKIRLPARMALSDAASPRRGEALRLVEP